MIKRFLTWLRQKYVYDEFRDVRDFHHKFGQLWYDEPGFISPELARQRHNFLQEELDELHTAMKANDLAGIADALVDLVYVAKGTAGMYGLPWEALWDDVQRANMAKVRGITHRGNAVDVKKPEGWVPPQTELVLSAAGYGDLDWFAVEDVSADGKEVTCLLCRWREYEDPRAELDRSEQELIAERRKHGWSKP